MRWGPATTSRPVSKPPTCGCASRSATGSASAAWTPAWAPWPVSFCDGRYNVTLDGRKLAGTAQRWRRNGAGRPVVLAHAALLVGAEREEMVEVVNTFTRRCASAPDCQADSHLGLSERWSDFRMADSLELERRFVAARS